MVFQLLHCRLFEYFFKLNKGVFLNKFSSDVNSIDLEYTASLERFFHSSIDAVTLVILTINLSPKIWLNLLVLAFLVSVFSLRVSTVPLTRELSRLVRIAQSSTTQMADHFIEHSKMIRAFNSDQIFRQTQTNRIDAESKNWLLIYGADGRLGFQFVFHSLVIIFLPLTLLSSYLAYEGSVKPSEGSLALFLISSFTLCPIIAKFLKNWNRLILAYIPFERCSTVENLRAEKGYLTLNTDCLFFENLNNQDFKYATRFIRSRKNSRLLTSGDIRLINVSVWYATSKEAVIKNMCLKLPDGQLLAVVGASGAGKTTLCRLLARTLEPNKGYIKVDHQDVRLIDLKEYREQVLVWDSSNFCVYKGTLASNISTKKMTNWKLSELRQLLIELGFDRGKLQRGDLGYRVDYNGSNLSSSEKLLLWLLRGLEKRARIVLMDEAFSGLGGVLKLKIWANVKRTYLDSTMVIFSNRAVEAMECDRVIVLRQGVVVEDGSPGKLVRSKVGAFYHFWKDDMVLVGRTEPRQVTRDDIREEVSRNSTLIIK